jgi:hypothetical protein
MIRFCGACVLDVGKKNDTVAAMNVGSESIKECPQI